LLSDDVGVACSAIGPFGEASPTGFTVGIPLVNTANGGESITWVSVLEEIRPTQEDDCPSRGPFSLVYLAAQDDCGGLDADPSPTRGVAAVRVNYPYQAAMLSGFRSSPTVTDPFAPNIANPIPADDGFVQENNTPPGGLLDDGGAIGTYAGVYGLGRQLALAGRVVRPFRRLVSAQAIQRREVFE